MNSASPSHSANGRRPANPYRVLLVEDDSDQAEMVMEFLRVSGPFHVEWSENLSGLWDHLEKGKPDIILLDYRLPDGTGLEALGELRRHGHNLPAIMVTGQGDERLAVRAMQLGAADYLVKNSDYLPALPSLIQKAVQAHELQLSVQRSLDQVRYQALLLNNVRDAVVVWNTEGKITYWNPAAEALFECKAADRLGQPVESNYLNAFTPPVRLPTAEGTSGYEVERRFKTRDGRAVWISSRVSALRDFGANGRLIGFMDVSRDITGRKKAEDALRSERNFVSTVLDTVGALVVVLDARGRIVRFNRTCEETTGTSFEEVQGKAVWDLFLLPEDVEIIQGVFRRLLAGEFPIENENIWVTRSGERRLISWANTALTDAQGQVKFIIATGIDITGRKQAEAQLLSSNEALRQSEARYRTISDLVSDFVYALRIDPGPTLTSEWITDAFEHVTGFKPNEIDWENHWLKLIHEDDNSSARRMGLRLLKGHKDVREFRIITKSGDVRWVRNYAQPVWDEAAGRVVRVYGAAKDITERKEMEAQIQAAQTRLTQSARLAAIGELASGVAHHINNPLTTVIAETQLLRHNLPADHPGQESAEAIEQAGWRVQKAVQQLLDFSRPAANTLELLSVNDTIRSALDFVSQQIKTMGIELQVDLAENLPLLRGNQRQLCDLWVNLLTLAKDATADGLPHTIQIQTRRVTDRSIAVVLRDDGETIPAAEMASLFEPNFTQPIGRRGTGIELTICQEIVRQHHGQISAESNPQTGTVFHLSFPVEVESD